MLSKALVVGAYQTKAEALAAEPDIELTVIAPPYWREGAQRLALERSHTRGYELLTAPMLCNGSYHLHWYPTLGRLLRRLRPDLCHIDEEPYNLATYLALRAARAVGARAICFAWQNLNRPYPPPFRWFEQAVYRRADGILAGNHAAAQVLRAKGYGGALQVIPQFGVDPGLFRPKEPPDTVEPSLRGRPRPLTIGYAGRLVPEKGLLVLAEALALLGGDWRLELYGDGPLRGELAARLAALGLAERATFHARIASTAMPGVLAGLDAVVLPSLTRPNWKEQFGRILIEAMACETTVVGSDSGEIPHVIGEAGLVTPEGDAGALAAALARLRDEAGLARRLGRAGRARVLAHYTQQQIAAQTAAFYREVMGR
jgi:glycosyltransferase involved in cell wall biosynthesis